ncbi:alpha/beta hydrolase [Xanthomonas theicola]|uniref:Alpha/beta hydrolase n=1 Tax=Xanthomonas theicola TaxID=56464 RepID=A0A2S6ZIL4_9XANT|nr:alpha/beta hydrolase [Xanthomonas theicola]PPT92113.1 alpha/beta hydrolase [Xanthomonas theicola]QNH25180.1 alpha/beta hydrolase [Xanthomonas theicola]
MSGPSPLPPRWPSRLLVALSSLLVSACSSVFFSGLNAGSARHGVSEQRGIVFDAAHGLQLDVYRPAAAHDAPVVVFFHGGTWKTGNRQRYRWAGEALARHGVVAIVPDYRKYPQATLDGFMRDAAAAVAWSRRHAAEHGGDPRRLVLMGHSAGAHMAALLATDGRWLQTQGLSPRQLCGLVGLAGPYDFLPLTDPDLIGMFGRDPTQQRHSQPVAFVDGDEPPALLLHGDADRVVEPRNSRSLQAALQRAGVPAELKTYPGVGHLRLVLALRKDAPALPVMADSIAFVRQCPARAAPP